jgi:hypothetical protein
MMEAITVSVTAIELRRRQERGIGGLPGEDFRPHDA